MSRTLLPIAGGVLGGMIGGTTGAQVGFALGSMIGSAVDPVTIKGPRIGETGAQTSAEGAPRGIVYGTAHVTGNVIASGEAVYRWVTERGGGKGGAPKTKREHAYRTFAIRICEGPIAGVLRAWEDDRLVYDVRAESVIAAESAKWIGNKAIYLGDEDQLPDPTLQAQVSGADDTPAYRGTAYIVVDSEDLTDRRGSIPQYRFEVSTTTTGGAPARWHDGVRYTGTGSGLASISSLDLSQGGMVIVSRLDAAEAPMIFYRVSGDLPVMQMGNRTILFGGGPTDNPVFSSAQFLANGTITLPTNTAGGDYLAFVFKSTPGAFAIDTYIGNGVAGRQVAHSLGAAPKMHVIRQLDDPDYTWSFMHVERFAGLRRRIFSSPNIGSAPDSSSWSNTPPTASHVTLGSDPAVNRDGGGFVMFLFGGDDCFADVITAGDQVSPGFDVDFFFLAPDFPTTGPNLGFYSTATNEFFGGDDTASVVNGTGGVADVMNRITRDGEGLYSIEQSGWTGLTVDVFAIRGTPPPGAPITLSEIVADLHARAGVDSGSYDTGELGDVVSGLVLAGDYTGADAIDVLRRMYFFDRFEADGKIRFPRRGAAVVDVLTIDDLVEEPDTSTREQAIEYPAKTHLFYQHAASGYARVKATAQRSSPDVRVVGEQSIEVPVVLGEDEAARIADKLQKVAWADAEGEATIVVPESFLRLTASDCIGLNLRGRVRRLRIEETGYADGRIEMKLRVDRQSAYTSAVTGIPIPDPTPPPNTIIGATVLAVLDIPARADPEDDLNLYFAVSAVEPAWYGALVERSMDGGATFTDAAQLERSMRIGVLTADLGAASEHYTDTTNRVRLRLLRATHDVESITEQAFLSEGGSFAVQSAGGDWEIMQYLDADDLGDQEFELSTLHRGRLATAAVAHATGALVVFLDDVEHTPAQAAWIGQSLTHRATSFGETTEGVAEQTATYEGRSQIEWPIAYLMLERDSNDVVSGAWTPRHRFGSDDFPVPSINFDGYRVTIDDGGAAVVIDTAAAEFSFDASAMGSPVTVSVAALNRITGAGPATSDTV